MEEQEGEEVLVEPDEGEMLVIRRALNVQRSTKDEERENIFHSRCIIQGKVCSLIVENESCINMAFVTLIEKLGLQTSVYPHPYCIQWLNHGRCLQANSRCLVSFLVGKNYFNKVWYDIIPKNVCHVLLGRP